MTAEQLEELLGKVTQGEWIIESGYGWTAIRIADEVIANIRYIGGTCNNENATLIALAPSLARRVIAAERLVEALEVMRDTTNRAGMYDYADNAITAYREASESP